MAFIDKLGEKIQSGAAAVTNSTKRMSETSRINSEISSNTQEIEKLMKKIGMCVKARHLDKIDDPEVKEYAAAIDSFIARNEQLSEELRAVKGLRRCTNCGADLAPNTVYCPDCGTKNDPAAAARPNVRPQPVPQPVPQPMPQVQPVPQPAPQPAPQTILNAAYVQSDPVIPKQQTTASTAQDFSQYAPSAEQTGQAASSSNTAWHGIDTSAGQANDVDSPVISAYAEKPAEVKAHEPFQTAVFCINCGYKETGDAIFCSNCGTKLER